MVPAGRSPAPPALVLRDLVGRDGTRDVRAEEFYNEIESDTFDPKESPALRAHLGRFDSRDSVLVLVACLPLIDVWSLNVVMADLMEYYAALREGREPRLPEVENYRGYVSGEQERWSGATIERAREYWNAALAGARPLAMTADHPPGDGSVTSCRRFSVGPELGNAALGLARELNCSLFMLLQAVHLVHLHRLTGQADGVVWTLTPGPARNQRATRDMVGYFVNMSPLRVDISGCGTLRETVARVRAFCLESYRNEIPFVRLVEGAPELMATLEQGGLVVPGFAVFQNPPAKHEDTPGSLVHVPCADGCRRPKRWTSPTTRSCGPSRPPRPASSTARSATAPPGSTRARSRRSPPASCPSWRVPSPPRTRRWTSSDSRTRTTANRSSDVRNAHEENAVGPRGHRQDVRRTIAHRGRAP
ncbi:hypothetical protein KGD82_07480 [Nocardiopsis eucommiae]|uniref:Condensation domain-containing protein n=1 Tax=Nocardiopsis eucommiae TaxID=2831970 RepID=A0A975QLC7_9ACTN|nr:hypothetical protein KGD82_07480 [Nocardiopsis eucommiae]